MDQLKEGWVQLVHEAKKAFLQLKAVMSSIPILALLDFIRPFILDTDALGHDLGTVLMQDDQRPIGYFSQMLSLRAHQKSVYERELTAIVLYKNGATTYWGTNLLSEPTSTA